jgi:cyclic pyranopterin monophosphate synthase
MAQKLSRHDASARVSMVDVSANAVATRTPEAQGFVKMKPTAAGDVRRLRNPKCNPLEVARIAGIGAAKRTAKWIPLCHPLPLTHVDVTATLCKDGVELCSSVVATAQTGVEMEALVAVTAAALTIYDMCKALDKAMEIAGIALVSKTGGARGDYHSERGVSRTSLKASKSRGKSKSRSKRGGR